MCRVTVQMATPHPKSIRSHLSFCDSIVINDDAERIVVKSENCRKYLFSIQKVRVKSRFTTIFRFYDNFPSVPVAIDIVDTGTVEAVSVMETAIVETVHAHRVRVTRHW